jgi:hypothetical protein
LEVTNQKGKCIYVEMPLTHGPVRKAFACGEREAGGAQQGEGDTGNSMGCSPWSRRQHHGRVTAVASAHRKGEGGREGARERGKRCSDVRGWCSPFIGARGSTREGWLGGNGGVNVFNAIEDGEVNGRVKEAVLMAGRVNAQGRHSRLGAGRRGVVGRGRIHQRRSRGRPAQGGRWS